MHARRKPTLRDAELAVLKLVRNERVPAPEKVRRGSLRARAIFSLLASREIRRDAVGLWSLTELGEAHLALAAA